MNRRRFLLLAGAATTSGCSSVSPFSGGDTPDVRDVGDRVVDVSATVPGSHPISITANVLEASITSERTAEFEVSITVTGERTQHLSYGGHVPYTTSYSESPAGLLIVRKDPAEMVRVNQQVWVPDTSDGRELGVSAVAAGGEFSPGESVTGRYSVWGDPEYVSYVEPGTYLFEESLGLEPKGADSSEEIPWSLTIGIAREDESA